MDATELLEAVREANETSLDRLGSERALVAETAATLDRETVLSTAAAAEARAATTFEGWAGDESNEDARETFAAVAEVEREHFEQVTSLAADAEFEDDPAPDAVHEYLRGIDVTIERVGAGLVGRPLVASRTLLQVINFFVNEGDETAAGTFREFRSAADDQARAGAERVVGVADDEDAVARARAAADRVVAAAYDEYADRLTEMGVDPKPVC